MQETTGTKWIKCNQQKSQKEIDNSYYTGNVRM
jgi:hypothetical protein